MAARDLSVLLALTMPSSLVALQSTRSLTRRTLGCGLAAAVPLVFDQRGAYAAATSSATAQVTAKVRLEFVEQVSAEEQRVLPCVIGLFGKDAPTAVRTFRQLCAGTLQAPCPVDVDLSSEVMERTKQAKKAALRACQGAEGTPVSYAYSQVWSIQRGRRIDAGQVQGKFALREAPTTPASEASGLSHDAAGLLSVRRGGGLFDFGITTAPTPEYDDEYIVIGRVVDGMDSIAALDAMPVVKAADVVNVEVSSAHTHEHIGILCMSMSISDVEVWSGARGPVTWISA